MKYNRTSSHRGFAVYVLLSAAVSLFFAAASIAFASLTFTSAGISGSSGLVIDSQGTISIGATAATGITIGTSTLPAGALFVIATSSNIMTVFSNGIIGIGTATPDSNVALDVNGPVEAVANTGGGGPAFSASTNNIYDYAYYGTNQQHQWGDVSDVIGLVDLENRQDGPGLYIDNINYSPVAGSAVLQLLSRPTNPVGDFILANSGAYPGIEKFAVDTNGGAYFAGNVGIGTAQPSSTLHIYTTSSTVEIGTSSTTGYGCLKMHAASGTPIGKPIWVYFDVNAAMIATTTQPKFCQ